MKLKISNYILISFIIGLVILGYGYLGYAKQQAKMKSDRVNKMIQEAKMNTCMNDAWDNYNLTFENECERRGLGSGCSLPRWLAEKIGDTRVTKEANCIKMFK